MRRIDRVARVTILGLAVCACSASAMLAKLIVPAHDKLARTFLSRIHHDSVRAAQAMLESDVSQVPGVDDSLWAVAGSLPAGEFDTLRVINVQRFWTNDLSSSQLTYELHGTNGWGVAVVTVVTREGTDGIESVQSFKTPNSQAELNAFTNGGSVLGWIILCAACVSVIFSVWAAVLLARSRMPLHWIWAAASLVGVSQFTVNWANGAYLITPARIQLLSAGFVRSGIAGPWMISVSLPLGACVALWKLRGFRMRARAETDRVAPHSPDGGDLIPAGEPPL